MVRDACDWDLSPMFCKTGGKAERCKHNCLGHLGKYRYIKCNAEAGALLQLGHPTPILKGNAALRFLGCSRSPEEQ